MHRPDARRLGRQALTSSSSTPRSARGSRPPRITKVDYNLHEGTEVTGSPDLVLLRGQVLVENGDLVAQPGRRPVREAGAIRSTARVEPHSRASLDGSAPRREAWLRPERSTGAWSQSPGSGGKGA
jgi:hypothetical protein